MPFIPPSADCWHGNNHTLLRKVAVVDRYKRKSRHSIAKPVTMTQPKSKELQQHQSSFKWRFDCSHPSQRLTSGRGRVTSMPQQPRQELQRRTISALFHLKINQERANQVRGEQTCPKSLQCKMPPVHKGPEDAPKVKHCVPIALLSRYVKAQFHHGNQ